MKRHCLVLPAGVPRGRLFPSELCLSAISRVVWTWPDPLPTGLNGDGKNVQTLWWAELDRLHSMTRAHPPLITDGVLVDAILIFTPPNNTAHQLKEGKGSAKKVRQQVTEKPFTSK